MAGLGGLANVASKAPAMAAVGGGIEAMSTALPAAAELGGLANAAGPALSEAGAFANKLDLKVGDLGTNGALKDLAFNTPDFPAGGDMSPADISNIGSEIPGMVMPATATEGVTNIGVVNQAETLQPDAVSGVDGAGETNLGVDGLGDASLGDAQEPGQPTLKTNGATTKATSVGDQSMSQGGESVSEPVRNEQPIADAKAAEAPSPDGTNKQKLNTSEKPAAHTFRDGEATKAGNGGEKVGVEQTGEKTAEGANTPKAEAAGAKNAQSSEADNAVAGAEGNEPAVSADTPAAEAEAPAAENDVPTPTQAEARIEALQEKIKSGNGTPEDAKEIRSLKNEGKNAAELDRLQARVLSGEASDAEISKWNQLQEKRDSINGKTSKTAIEEAADLQTQMSKVESDLLTGKGDTAENMTRLQQLQERAAGIQNNMTAEQAQEQSNRLRPENLALNKRGMAEKARLSAIQEKLRRLMAIEMHEAQAPQRIAMLQQRDQVIKKEIAAVESAPKANSPEQTAKQLMHKYQLMSNLAVIKADINSLQNSQALLKVEKRVLMAQVRKELGLPSEFMNKLKAAGKTAGKAAARAASSGRAAVAGAVASRRAGAAPAPTA